MSGQSLVADMNESGESGPGRRVLPLVVVAAVGALALLYVSVGNQEATSVDADVPLTQRDASSASAVTTLPEKTDADNHDVLTYGLPTPGCDFTRADASPAQRREQSDRMFETALSTLSAADDAELLFAAGLIAPKDDAGGRVELFRRAAELAPDHPLILWQLLQFCDESMCDTDELDRRALSADGANAAVHVQIASRHLQNGRDEEALDRLRRAAAANRFDVYFIDHVLLLERAFAASTDAGYIDRHVVATGIAAAMAIPMYGPLSRACQSETNDDARWESVCNQLGVQMSESANDLLSISLGFELRKKAALRRGDEAAASEFERERNALWKSLIARQTEVGVHALFENDSQFVQRYFETYAAHGEMVAAQSAIDEALRLRADPTYDQCNFVRGRLEDGD